LAALTSSVADRRSGGSKDVAAGWPPVVTRRCADDGQSSVNVFCHLTRYHAGRLISPPGAGAAI